jgi:hypothetical protein
MKEYIEANRYLFVGKVWELRQLVEERRAIREEVLKP